MREAGNITSLASHFGINYNQYSQLGEKEEQDMKEGLDNFFSKTASSPGGQGSSATPIGSPMVEDIKNLSTSSTPSPSLVSRSREDLRMKVRVSQESGTVL